MEKDREISGHHPNAASKDAVDDARRRVAALEIPWHDAVEQAGLSRNVGFTLLRYKASVASLRKLEDWLVKKEAEKPRSTGEPALAEWMRLGEELARLDEPQFEQMLEGLRELVKVEKQRHMAILKIFRATPDRRR